MTFAHPHWFWALAVVPVQIGFFLRNESLRAKLLRKLVAARLLDRLAGNVSVGKRRVRFILLLLGMAAVIVSLAQPRYGYRWEESKRKGRDVLIAIDVSKSMLATDLAPNRLARAKYAAQDLIAQLGGDRVGVIAFAGSAFLQAPLTADFTAVLGSLNELDPEIIPRGGTNLAEAIRVAVEAFGKGESEHRALIIFTDGEELDADGIKAAEGVKDSVKIFGVGIGSADGSLIPLGGSGEFVKDDAGQIVKSRLDEVRLRKIAELTGGFYVHLLNGPAEMTQIVRDGLGGMTEKEIDTKTSRQPIERYQWPLALGIALLAISMLLGERRRVAAAALMLFTWLPAPQAAAVTWISTPGMDEYRAGETALREQNEAEAKKQFGAAFEAFQQQAKRRSDSPEAQFNLGAAAYHLDRENEALEAFGRALLTTNPKLRTSAEKNLGHTLFRSGEKKAEKDKTGAIKTWEDALSHYESALKIEPENREVQADRDYVQQRIEELKKQEEQKKDDNSPPKKQEPSEAAKQAKAAADAAVLRREYKAALDIMEKQLKVDETTQAYADYIQRLQEVNGVPKTNEP